MREHEVDILLVEDNPDDVALALHVLSQNNVTEQIHVARDGVEALQYVFGEADERDSELKQHPRVVLLDLKLPRVDGFDVLREMKTHPQAQVIPIVVLTSSLEQQDLSECYELGANSYLVKPVDYQEFSDMMHHVGLYWLHYNKSPDLL